MEDKDRGDFPPSSYNVLEAGIVNGATKVTSIEEQSVLATRFFSRMLITACIAILLAFSLEERNVYQNAVAELTSLLNLNVSSAFTKAVRAVDRNVNDHFSHIESIFSDYDLSLTDVSSDSSALIWIRPWPDVRGYTLERIKSYFTDTSQLSVTVRNIDSKFEQSLRAVLEETPEHVKTVKVAVRSSEVIISSSGYEQRIQLDKLPTEEKFDVRVDLLLAIGDESSSQLLATDLSHNQLFLPNLTKVWDQIRLETPRQARTILARKDSPSEKRLEVFGLSIPQSQIAWAVPTLLFVISIYLLVHVQKLNSIVKGNPDVRNYPWVGMMPGMFSETLSVVGLIILPVIALIQTMRVTWGSQFSPMRVVSTGMLLATFITLVVVNMRFFEIKGHRFRRKG